MARSVFLVGLQTSAICSRVCHGLRPVFSDLGSGGKRARIRLLARCLLLAGPSPAFSRPRLGFLAGPSLAFNGPRP
eukprot:14575048-Alexandrium_andersonii.AAC.1